MGGGRKGGGRNLRRCTVAGHHYACNSLLYTDSGRDGEEKGMGVKKRDAACGGTPGAGLRRRRLRPARLQRSRNIPIYYTARNLHEKAYGKRGKSAIQ